MLRPRRSPKARWTWLVCTSLLLIVSASSASNSPQNDTSTGPGAGWRQRRFPGDRGIEACERVVCPAKQQMVDRAKEQERGVLTRTATGGQVKQRIMIRDGLAQ